MALDGDPIVLKNNGAPSLYNTKPPLVIWLQALSIQLLGPGELAIRLPSALAALLTVLLLLLFAHRTLGDLRVGIVATLVLVTTAGYVRNHVARSGDLDAVLIFWIVAYSLLAFHYLLKDPPRYRTYFNWMGLGLVAAFLSKSVAGWMPLLGLAGAALVAGRLGSILKKSHFYSVAFGVLGLAVGYYLWRESLGAGYWDKVFFSEFQRLTENIMPWHERPFGFYATNMWERQFFTPHVYLLLPALLLAAWRPGEWRTLSGMLLVFCLAYFLLISYPPVKLEWYAAPLYPFLALLIGMGWCRALDLGRQRLPGARAWRQVLFYLSLIGFFSLPYYQTLQRIRTTGAVDPLEREGQAIRHWRAVMPELKSYRVLMSTPHPEHLDQLNFYRKAVNHWEGGNLRHVGQHAELVLGDTVLCCQRKNLDSLRLRFRVEEWRELGDCKLWKLR